MPEPESTTESAERVSDIEQIASLLYGEPEPEKAKPPEKAPEVEAAEPEKEEAAAPEEAAEESALDYGMEVPMTNGEKVTLGALKDAYQKRDNAMLELTERENEVLRETEKAQMLLSYISQLPPEVAEAAKVQATNDYQREMQLLTRVMPEVKTAEGAREVRETLYELAAEYGVPRSQIDQIKHAVTIKMMHDFARLKASIKAAKQNVKPLRADSPRAVNGVPSSKSDLQAAIDKAKASRSTQDEAKAIDALLRSA